MKTQRSLFCKKNEINKNNRFWSPSYVQTKDFASASSLIRTNVPKIESPSTAFLSVINSNMNFSTILDNKLSERFISVEHPGDPPPRLRWYHGSSTLQATSSSQMRFVRSELKLRNFTRSQLGSIYTCVASTGSVSVDTSVQLDLNCK